MSELPPTMGYQPSDGFKHERRRHLCRVLKRIGKIFGLILGLVFGLLVLLIGGDITYQCLRHKTTVAEVQGWMAALPPNATRNDVTKLFDARGMEWVKLAASCAYGTSTHIDPSDHDGFVASLDDVEERWMMQRTITVVVRFDKNDRIKSIDVFDEWIGP